MAEERSQNGASEDPAVVHQALSDVRRSHSSGARNVTGKARSTLGGTEPDADAGQSEAESDTSTASDWADVSASEIAPDKPRDTQSRAMRLTLVTAGISAMVIMAGALAELRNQALHLYLAVISENNSSGAPVKPVSTPSNVVSFFAISVAVIAFGVLISALSFDPFAGRRRYAKALLEISEVDLGELIGKQAARYKELVELKRESTLTAERLGVVERRHNAHAARESAEWADKNHELAGTWAEPPAGATDSYRSGRPLEGFEAAARTSSPPTDEDAKR